MRTRCIYIIKAESGPVKIGIAGNVRTRLGQLQNASAYPLEVIYAAQVGRDAEPLERRVHRVLEAERMAGEWFNVMPELAIRTVLTAADEMGLTLADIDGPATVPNTKPDKHMTPVLCKAARAMAGVSQQALANSAKVSKATVAAFEAGKRTPYDWTLAALQSTLEGRGVQFTPDGVQMARAD